MLQYTRETRIPCLLGVRNYFCYKRLDQLPYTRGTRIPPLLGFKNYLNNYVTIYRRLTRSLIRVEVASPAYLRLKII